MIVLLLSELGWANMFSFYQMLKVGIKLKYFVTCCNLYLCILYDKDSLMTVNEKLLRKTIFLKAISQNLAEMMI